MIVNCRTQECSYISETIAFKLFQSDIRRYKVLTVDEQLKLVVEAHNQNKMISQNATNRLVQCNQRFVLSIAKKMTNGNNILDLINEGNIGLLEAIKRFDYTDTSRGNNFVTYAVYWIRKYMQNYLITKDKIVRPANYHKLFNLVSKIKNDFYVKNERQPTLEEVSSIIRERYHLNVENLDELETIIPMSIDENGEDDNMNTTNVEHTEKYNSRTSSNNIESHYDDIEKTNTINLVLRRLDPREQTIIRRMYGIDNDGVCSTMESIAKDLCLSKERVRQLYTKSLEKMKHIGKQYINGEL